MTQLKVSTKSKPASVAGALTHYIKENESVTMLAVGAGAINQAIKAIAIARGMLTTIGIDISCVPSFTDVNIDTGIVKTGILFSFVIEHIN